MLIQILSSDSLLAEFRTASAIVVGRQSLQMKEEGPYRLAPGINGEPGRLIVAPSQEETVSRRAFLLEPRAAGSVAVQNLAKSPLQLQTETTERLETGMAIERPLPFEVFLSGLRVRVAAEEDWEQLSTPTPTIHTSLTLAPKLPDLPALSSGQLDDLVRWMQMTAGVFQRTLSTMDFVPAAAAALVEIVGLDSGRILLDRGGRLEEVACHSVGEHRLPPSQSVLERVRTERRTFWKKSDDRALPETAVSKLLATVVAAPILEPAGEVIGVLYGDRRLERGTRPIGKPEALLVEMLACGIATGLARQRHQDRAAELETRFAQFFSRPLAEQLARDPSLLGGREAEVSLLFADVRGFSRISERIGPALTVKWIGELMQELSEPVLAEDGVLVDYIGDELVAMWGAPTSQPDHAVRAVRAGLAMLQAMPRVSERWRDRVGEPCEIGVGINSGPALVGNIGSQVKFKYGALGNTVNLASRVQGLTKYLKRPFLVTGETRRALGTDFIARRVCKTRVMNIAGAVDLFEVEPAGADDRRKFFEASEEALSALEDKDFAKAARLAGTLLGDHNGDGPLLVTLSRAAAQLADPDKGFDPVWAPPGK